MIQTHMLIADVQHDDSYHNLVDTQFYGMLTVETYSYYNMIKKFVDSEPRNINDMLIDSEPCAAAECYL